ncbi:MAG: hypothetical protein IJI37_01170, partial [Opitutales bacterium]|nr:hypothetical protein [Opitutales bacterium]
MKRRSFVKSAGALAAAFAGASANAADAAAKPSNKKSVENPKLENLVFEVGKKYDVKIFVPESSGEIESIEMMDYDKTSFPSPAKIEIEKRGGCYVAKNLSFPKEDSYAFYIKYKGGEDKPAKNLYRRKADLFACALEPDLFKLSPLNGDFHQHSTVSDGKLTPLQMAVMCVETNLDIHALTDHRKREGSAQLMEEVKNLPIHLKSFYGEEVHSHGTVHVQSLGAREGADNYIKEYKEEFEALVEKNLKKMPENDRDEQAARAMAAFDIVRKLGGVAGFNHPYWAPKASTFSSLRASTQDKLYRYGTFDYLEIVNGISVKSCEDDIISLSVSKYFETLAAGGAKRPILGCSDVHNLTDVASGRTIVFAENDSFEAFAKAVRSGMCVAVDDTMRDVREQGKTGAPRIYGNSARLVKYAAFIDRHFLT